MKDKRLVIGMGASGYSLAALWCDAYDVTAIDDRSNPPRKNDFIKALPQVRVKTEEKFRNWSYKQYEEYAYIGVSPGISPQLINAPLEKITSDAACFSDAWQREAPPASKLVAITGTNGKSTAVSLVTHLAEIGGLTAQAVGNIGEPMLDALRRWRQGGFPDFVVVELSSFQLELSEHFYSDAAVVLNISDDHLDRHNTIQKYADIKRAIYNCTAHAVVNSEAAIQPPQTYSSYTTAAANADWTVQDGWICKNNLQHYQIADMSDTCRQCIDLVLAALALIDGMAIPQHLLRAGLATFSCLPHRRQLLANHNGVRYINDSKATNVGATLYAFKDIKNKIIWIGGGDGKGQDFSPLREIAAAMRLAILMGKDAAQIEAVLAAAGVECLYADDMQAALRLVCERVQPHDTVLLSPACSSLDMYADYHARGLAFAKAVQEQINAG